MLIPKVKSPLDTSFRNTVNLLVDLANKFDGNQLIEYSYNLLNPEAMVPGTLNGAGDVVESDSSSVTEFIPFPPNAPFNIKPTGKITHFYDAEYNNIQRFTASSEPPHTSPPGTAFVRMAILNTRIDETWAYQGADDKPYKDYGFKPSEKIFDADFIQEVKSQIGVAKKLIQNSLDIKKYENLFNKDAVIEGHYINRSTGELVESSGFWASEFIPIIPGEKVMIGPTVGQTAFYDIDYNYVAGAVASTGWPYTIPDNAYYMRTSGSNNSLNTKMVYLGEEVIDFKPYGQTADTGLFSTNKLTFNSEGFPEITVPYDDSADIDFIFGQLGINNIYHLRRARTEDWNLLYGTDYISPYRVKATNNPIADNPAFVTGGNHGSDGSGGGHPTARPRSIDVYIDNKKVTSGTHRTNSPIVVKVVNDACAYNTVNRDTGERRDVLRETITYTFYPNGYAVSIDIRALEPIEFERHRGIAMQRHHHNHRAYVPMDDTGVVDATSPHDFKSSDNGSAGTRLVHWNQDGHLAVMYIDNRMPIGDFNLNNADPRFFMSAGKSYANTIELGANYQLNNNQSLQLNAGYYFGKGLPYATINDGKAYTIMLNGRRVYCVDDFRSSSYGEYYLQLLPEDENKEVKVIKSEGISVGGFTTSRGARLTKASGIGSLMFEVI